MYLRKIQQIKVIVNNPNVDYELKSEFIDEEPLEQLEDQFME